MNFAIDEQTLKDLNIFQRNKKNSIHGLFDSTKTRGGKNLLKHLFQHPLADTTAIEERIALFRFFCEHPMEYPFEEEMVGIVFDYIQEHAPQTQFFSGENSIKIQLKLDTTYNSNRKGVSFTIRLLRSIRDFITKIEANAQGTPYEKEVTTIKQILDDERLSWALKGRKRAGSYEKVVTRDTLFRFDSQELFQQLFSFIHWLDVYISVANIARTRGFVFARPLPKEKNQISIKGLYHPHVKNAVKNDITIKQEQHVIFLTGANMAGKSTFMKSFGLAIYLAHLGFPVAAKEMTFSIKDGLFTTINLPDQIKEGYSHFYAEVKRVKAIAQDLVQSPYSVIISDELFRGTNVKDAYDGTLAITQAYVKRKETLFMISTHIVEVGEELKKYNNDIRFIYFPTVLEGGAPMYSYKLQEGITKDRFGMYIVNNEQIVDTITGKKKIDTISEAGIAGQFFTDPQTIKDLALYHPLYKNSILTLYNKTQTEGGAQYLRILFLNPRANRDEIENRSKLFKYFTTLNTHFPIDNYLMKTVETYWNLTITRYTYFSFFRILWWRILKFFTISAKFNFVKNGILSTIKVMNNLQDYLTIFEDSEIYQKQRTEFQQILNHKKIRCWYKSRNKEKLSLFKLAKFDYRFRCRATKELQHLCQLLYELDACISIAKVAKEKQLVWAEPCKTENYLHIEELYHPALEDPVTNSIHLDEKQNLFFLTGANMAGKSTFMKSIGIAIYLAHAGFPIPAKKMEFSILDGMYTSINLSDNISLGYSHFFTEVSRVKTIAEELNRDKKLIIIMDELFKGTNVKDAYDATSAITNAFAGVKKSLFLVSTHIIETADELQKKHTDIQFRYFPVFIKDNKPVYSYALTDGITSDRFGMMIINNEKLIETIEKGDQI